MDKAIVTTLMIIASVICAVLVFRSVLPAVTASGASVAGAQARMQERINSDIQVIHAAAERDSGGWRDTNSNGVFDVFVWVKNVGSARVGALEATEVFFGPEGSFQRIPHVSQAGGNYPAWEGEVEDGGSWDPTRTVRITVHCPEVLTSGRYYVKVVLTNGIADTYYLGI
ncbi:MAG: hypothetical protein ACYC4R_16160 [Anaerolineae bacterium]